MTDYGKPQDTPFARKMGLVKPDMIERVAMAMYSSTGVEFGLQEEWKDRHDKTKDEWRHLARAAIAAMRDCTPAMLDAGSAAHPAGGYTRGTLLNDIIECEWVAMCDAALTETKSETKGE